MQKYSDSDVRALYKESRGVEPTEYFWKEWTQAPDSVKQEIWDNLCYERDAQYAH